MLTSKMFGYYAEIIVPIVCFCFLLKWRRSRSKNSLMWDLPLIGMLPELLFNLNHIHDFVAFNLKRHGNTGEFRGPCLAQMNYLVTADPMNVHHMMSKNFDNYVKGPAFREIFQAFGDGIFTVDSELWKRSRTLLHGLFKSRSFENFLEKIIHKKVRNCLIPLLDHFQEKRIEVDLQDVFNRFNFDNICSVVLGSDPNCLAPEFPEIETEKAFNEAEEGIFYRHVVPRSFWKLQKWLQIGEEKKMTKACKVFDHFLNESIAWKRKELSQSEMEEEKQVDLLTALIREEENEKGQSENDKFLRDTAFNLFVAGRDTLTSALSWFFWLVSKHPSVESKILDEIKEKFGEKKVMILGVEEVKKLVYLHGALSEALRLFPPIPFERKQPLRSDVLPSGHHVDSNTTILLSLYAMGRSDEIWGEDCLEFKPERWISEKGGIVHVPSYKFISFNAGPRTCLGKDMSFVQMKMIASAVLWNYCIQVVDGHPVSPSLSIVLLMKYGLKVKVSRRQV